MRPACFRAAGSGRGPYGLSGQSRFRPGGARPAGSGPGGSLAGRFRWGRSSRAGWNVPVPLSRASRPPAPVGERGIPPLRHVGDPSRWACSRPAAGPPPAPYRRRPHRCLLAGLAGRAVPGSRLYRHSEGTRPHSLCPRSRRVSIQSCCTSPAALSPVTPAPQSWCTSLRPGPPESLSVPGPPHRTSSPLFPHRVSLPASP